MKKLLFILLVLPSLSFAKPHLPWERIMDPTNNSGTGRMYRMSVPHGWLVFTGTPVGGNSSIFVPDENHEWVLDASLAE